MRICRRLTSICRPLRKWRGFHSVLSSVSLTCRWALMLRYKQILPICDWVRDKDFPLPQSEFRTLNLSHRSHSKPDRLASLFMSGDSQFCFFPSLHFHPHARCLCCVGSKIAPEYDEIRCAMSEKQISGVRERLTDNETWSGELLAHCYP